MSPPRWWVALLLAWGLHAAWAQTDVPSQDAARVQRQGIDAARARAEADFVRQEQACQSRFAVQACVDRVAAQRRAQERELKRQEAVLNAADRQQRAQEQLQRSAEKQRDHQMQAAAPSGDTAAERLQAQQQKQHNHRQVAPAPPSVAASKPLPTAPTAAAQAASREAYVRKQRAAQERRTARDKRLQETMEKRPALPTPP